VVVAYGGGGSPGMGRPEGGTASRGEWDNLSLLLRALRHALLEWWPEEVLPACSFFDAKSDRPSLPQLVAVAQVRSSRMGLSPRLGEGV